MDSILDWLGVGDSDRGARRLGIGLGLGVLALTVIGWSVYPATDDADWTPTTEEHSSVRTVELPAALIQADGEQIYSSRCSTCHQASGKGVPGVFPPLDGTDWVTGDKGQLIRIILHGLSGSIEVKGQAYSGSMPPWGSFLSNEEVAQVASYVRQNFGNEAGEVTAAEVEKVRQAHSDRKKPWTAEELSDNQGIPGAEDDSKGGESRSDAPDEDGDTGSGESGDSDTSEG